MNQSSIIKKVFSLPMLFLLILIILFFPVLFLDKVMFYRDLAIQDYPQTEFVMNSIKSGVFPFWNPYIFSGFPQFASIQPPLSYPLIYIYLLFPFHIGLAVFLIAHLFIAFYGVYLIGKKWEFDESICMLGGVVFALNSYTFENYAFQYILAAIAWLPYVFLYFEKSIEKVSLKNFTLLTIFSFLFLSTCRVDYFYFTSLFLAFYTLLRLIFRDFKLKDKINNIISIWGSFVLGLGLFSFQLLPMYEFLSKTRRGSGINFEGATLFSMNPLQLLNTIFYNFFGDLYQLVGFFKFISNDERFFIYNLYLGLFVVLVSFFPFKFRQKSEEKKELSGNLYFILMASFILFTIISLGHFSPLYRFLYDYLPVFSNLRFPIKIFFLPVFCISLLFMLGLNNLSATNKKLKMVAIRLNILLLAIYFGLKNYIPHTKATAVSFNSMETEIAIFSICTILLYFYYHKRFDKNKLLISLVIILSSSFYYNSYRTLWLSDRNYIYEKSDVELTVSKNLDEKKNYFFYTPDDYKIADTNKKVEKSFSIKVAYNGLTTNFPMMFQLRSIYGYYPGEPSKQSFLYSVLSNQIQGLNITYAERLTLLRNMSVKFYLHVLGDKLSFDKENFDLLGKYDKTNFELWSVKNAKKRVSFYNKSFILNDEEELLRRFLKRDLYKIDDETCFIFDKNLTKEEFFDTSSKNSNLTDPEIIDENANYLKIKVKNTEKGFLVVNDSYDKDWKAYENNKEVPILEANYMYRGIKVDSVGEHLIELKYLPQSFIKGMFFSLISLILFTFINILWYKKKGWL